MTHAHSFTSSDIAMEIAKTIAEMKAFMVTSSMLSEGKSTITSLLAITAAKKGIKTIIVDSDLRRPVIHKLFKLERQLGLHEVLAEETAAKSVIKKTSLDNLDIITAGKISAHPAEVFNGPAIGRLIEEMKFYYDKIIIDSAPIIPVSDPLFVANEVDGVVLVIKAGQTQREVVQRAVDILRTNNSKLMGVILNNMSGSLPYYYDYSYYGYHYEQKPPGLIANNKIKQFPKKAQHNHVRFCFAQTTKGFLRWSQFFQNSLLFHRLEYASANRMEYPKENCFL